MENEIPPNAPGFPRLESESDDDYQTRKFLASVPSPYVDYGGGSYNERMTREEVSKSTSSPSLSLLQIEDTIVSLQSLYESSETDEERAVAEQEIQRFILAELRKVNGIAFTIRAFEKKAEFARQERDRLAKRVHHWEGRVQALKNYVLWALNKEELKRVESTLSVLRRHGQADKVKIDDPSLIPEEFVRLTVQFNASDWNALKECVPALCATGKVKESEFMLDQIGKALKRKEEVPGARLLTDQEHLRVE